ARTPMLLLPAPEAAVFAHRTLVLLLLPALAAVIPWQARPLAADPSSGPPGIVKSTPTPDELRAPLQKTKQPTTQSKVYRDQVTPHWFADDTKFWYRNDLKGGTKEFILVDAEKSSRGKAFDHGKLATALSKAAGKEYSADRLPFDDITFTKD